MWETLRPLARLCEYSWVDLQTRLPLQSVCGLNHSWAKSQGHLVKIWAMHYVQCCFFANIYLNLWSYVFTMLCLTVGISIPFNRKNYEHCTQYIWICKRWIQNTNKKGEYYNVCVTWDNFLYCWMIIMLLQFFDSN